MVAVAETVLERPEPWRPPRASHVVFGATTIVAIIALVAILVPMVSGARVTPRHQPEVFLPPAAVDAHAFDGWQKIEHKIKKVTEKASPGKASVTPSEGDGGGKVAANATHVSQSAIVHNNDGGGIASNSSSSSTSGTSGDNVNTSNNVSSSSHSTVTSNNGSSHVGSGTSKNSVKVHSSSKVIKGGSHDDWDDTLDDIEDWTDDFDRPGR